MHDKYIEPNKKFANLIIDNNTNYKSIYQEIEIKLNKIDKKNKKI
jgi:uridine kinase